MNSIKTEQDRTDERGGIVAFRVPAELMAAVETAAAAEGISKADVARRALLRDLKQVVA